MIIGTISLYDPADIPETDKFIYLLEAKHVNPGKRFPRKVKTFSVGYFESLEAAESYLKEYCLAGKRGEEWDKSLHHFEIEKMPLNSELGVSLGYWIYLKNGSLFRAYPDVDAPFLGAKESDRKFSEKEIVEVMVYSKLELAIVVSLPSTPEEMEQRKRRAVEKFNYRSYEYDFSDYIFHVVFYKKGITAENIKATDNERLYDHYHGLNIFPLSSPILLEQKKILEDLYEMYRSPREK